ncbi:MAG: chaperonin [Pseudobdellovibrio sp.]|jgi:chaperonin GroES|nr:chaperonin [Pseudobdellovibrio sp.]
MATKKKLKKTPKTKPAKKAASKSAKKPAAKAAKKSAAKAANKKTSKAKPSKKAAKPAAKKSSQAAKKPAVKAVAAKVSKPAFKATPKVNIDYTKAITPLLDRLVVRVMNTERLMAGGLIIIPDTALMATGYLKAEVLAVGTGNKSKKGYLKPLDVKVGDKVLFAEYSGTKVQFNSEELHIIHEADVMGILEE